MKQCIVCGADIPKGYLRYCSKACRDKFNSKKFQNNSVEWNRKKRAQLASVPSPDKKQCAICGGWYVQVCTHVRLVHNMSAKEYKLAYGLPIKRGISPAWYRELKGRQAKENKTCLNLKKGKAYRFTKGDPRALLPKGSIGHKSNPCKHNKDYYE